MKKFLSIMLLAFLALVLVACGSKDQDLLDEQLSALAITYADGENATNVKSNVTLSTIDADGFGIMWTSNNDAITSEGKVTRPEAGQADVTVELTATVTYNDLSGTKSFTLVVKAKDAIKPLSIEITGNDKMQKGSTYTLNATVAPENATDKTITWSSDTPAVAKVDADGKVTAVEIGTAVITATANGNSSVKETFTVTVVEPTADTIAATQAKAKGENGWVVGVVIATYSRGYLVYDGTGAILVYMNTTEFTQKVGDYVEIKGELDEYNGAKQFTDSATVSVPEGTAPEYKLSSTKLKDGDSATAFMGAFEFAKKVSFRMTVTSTSDSYINGVIKGSEVPVAICYPADKAAYTVEKDYDVIAYALYTNEYNSVNTLYVMVDSATEVDYGFDVNITYKDGESVNVEVVNSLTFPIVDLTEPEEKEGYTFLGWYTGTEEAPVRVYALYSAEDITLFSKWVADEDAPIFVDPACEDGSACTSITEALSLAKEGQEIYLAPGDYEEEYVTPVERVYNTTDALLEAYAADYRATVGRSSGGIDLFETSSAESSWMTTMLSDAVMTAKWSWLYKAIAEVVENEDMDPETFTPADVRFNFLVNLYGLFSNTQHTESYSKSCVSANFANPALVKKVLLAGPKVDETQNDTYESKIIIDKKVTFVGPNANVLGQDSENRNEEANIKSSIEITADGVTFDGCAFIADGMVGLGADDITFVNCRFNTTKYGHGDADNRQACIYNMAGIRPANITIENTYFSIAATSYTTEAITAGSTGIENLTINNCEFTTDATAPSAYECIYLYGLFGDFIFTNNKCYFPTSNGYFACVGQTTGSYIRYCLIQDNLFTGVGENCNATFAIKNIKNYNNSDSYIDIIHNQFVNFAPTTFRTDGAATNLTANLTINYLYNYFDAQQQFKISNTSTGTLNFDHNCVLGALNSASAFDPSTQVNKYDTLEALEAAYVTYKAAADATNTVTFNTDGGNEIAAVSFANPYLVKLPTPEKADYEFAGWYNGENKVTMLTAKEDVTLTAHWVKINTITFDVDGGSAVEAIKFTDYSKVGTLPVSSKEGITFGGWYEGENKVEAITENRDYNLKAKWEGDYTITYDTDGGNTIETVEFSDYTKVTLATPVKDGYDFVGWYNGDTKVEALTENNSITLKAKWAKLYTITYDYNGGSIVTAELDILSYGWGKSYWTSANHPTTVWLLSKANGDYEGATYRYANKWGLSYDANTKTFTVVASYPAADVDTADVSAIVEDYAIICNNSYANATAFKALAVGDTLTLSVDLSTLTSGTEVDVKMYKQETSRTVTTSELPNSNLLTGVTKGEQVLEGWYNGEDKVTEITEANNITLVAHFMDKPTGLIYKTAAELAEAYMADWNAATGKSLTGATLDTAHCNSSDMTDALQNAAMNTKWAWLYAALNTVTGDADKAIGTADVTTSAVKGYYFANLCGLFTQTQHTDSYLSTQSIDWSVEANVTAVLNAGPSYED